MPKPRERAVRMRSGPPPEHGRGRGQACSARFDSKLQQVFGIAHAAHPGFDHLLTVAAGIFDARRARDIVVARDRERSRRHFTATRTRPSRLDTGVQQRICPRVEHRAAAVHFEVRIERGVPSNPRQRRGDLLFYPERTSTRVQYFYLRLYRPVLSDDERGEGAGFREHSEHSSSKQWTTRGELAAPI
jgi:hypothetical protein